MPKLTQFSLENYKSFKDQATISVRPLTLFFGYNSAGKSAALRFLKLLSDSTNGSGPHPLNLRSEVLKGSDFSSLLSKYSPSQRIEIGLEFEEITAKITIINLPDLHRQAVEVIDIQHSMLNNNLVLEWLPDENTIDECSQTYTVTSNSDYSEVDLVFNGLVPTRYPIELAEYFKPLADSLEAFGNSYVGLSTDCVVPDRFHLETSPAKTVTRRGEGMISILQTAPVSVINDISSWYVKSTGYSFRRKQISIGNQSGHRFTLHPNSDENVDIDIIDTGEGMGQVLPVVGLVTLARHGMLGAYPTISLEHPELHIHPDAHIHLADLFCEAVLSDPAPRILVETHSENLLLGVQLAIAEGRIKPTDVAIHWVRGTSSGSVVEHIEFDLQARPVNDDWPVDVFRSNTKLARELYEQRKALSK